MRPTHNRWGHLLKQLLAIWDPESMRKSGDRQSQFGPLGVIYENSFWRFGTISGLNGETAFTLSPTQMVRVGPERESGIAITR